MDITTRSRSCIGCCLSFCSFLEGFSTASAQCLASMSIVFAEWIGSSVETPFVELRVGDFEDSVVPIWTVVTLIFLFEGSKVA